MRKSRKIIGIALMASLFFAFSWAKAHAGEASFESMKSRALKVATLLEPSTGLATPRITIVNDELSNAYVLPDRTIVITSGLLESCASEDELAFIIAHEISHIVARDYNRNYTPELLSSTDLPAWQLRELNADINAIYYIRLAGFDPGASVKVLSRLAPPDNQTSKRRLDTLSTYLKTLQN